MFQHWQSELVLFSHWKSGQKGSITRLVSGCHKSEKGDIRGGNTVGGRLEDTVPLETLQKSTHPAFVLHVTPNFEEARQFSWFNKPLSIQHWMDHATGGKSKQGTVLLLDPDMPIIKPLTQHPLEPSQLLFDASHTPAKRGMNVAKRHAPVAARYGIGAGWFRYDRVSICGPDSPCAKMKAQEAIAKYAVGPPILMQVEDMAGLVTKWYPYMKQACLLCN